MESGKKFLVVPAVDVLDGRAVRLRGGDYERITTRAGDPLAAISRAAATSPPFVHVVALGAARDGGVPLELAEQAVAAAAPVPVQLGGGVRSVADAAALTRAGVARVLVGTAAFGGIPLGEFVAALGDRLVVAVDVAADRVRIAGWVDDGGLTLHEAIDRCREAGVRRILCTAIERDGSLGGPDLALVKSARRRFDDEILAAGGIRDEADVAALQSAGANGAVVGRAWLEGKLELGPGVLDPGTRGLVSPSPSLDRDSSGAWEGREETGVASRGRKRLKLSGELVTPVEHVPGQGGTRSDTG